ncbi:MAG: hypothetical protein WCT45_02400 [Candidatus Paceibacterota bacterium]|jgi:hypothetical protein
MYTTVLSSAVELMGVSAETLASALLVSIVTTLAVSIQSWIVWRRAVFEDCINISLNTRSDEGKLCIETIYDGPMKKIIPSAYARRLVKKASKKTTRVDEFLHFVDGDVDWIVSNYIRNAISTIYGAKILAERSAGNKTKEQLVFAETFERDTPVRLQKVRVLLVLKSELAEGWLLPTWMTTDVPEHRSRIDSLAVMYQKFVRDDWPDHKTVSLPKER